MIAITCIFLFNDESTFGDSEIVGAVLNEINYNINQILTTSIFRKTCLLSSYLFGKGVATLGFSFNSGCFSIWSKIRLRNLAPHLSARV